MFAGNFEPRGWRLCQGQKLPVVQYGTLSKILSKGWRPGGKMGPQLYGGDGKKTITLPDLRGRLAMHAGKGPGLEEYQQGKAGGSETVTLKEEDIPSTRYFASATSPSEGKKTKSGHTSLLTVGLESNESLKVGQSKKAKPFSIMQPFAPVHFLIAEKGQLPVPAKEKDKPADGGGFVGEIRIFAGDYAPSGWAFCDGQLVNISENSALFSILGTTYGGNGRTTFALPDLRGRGAIHAGQGRGLKYKFPLGSKSGSEIQTLLWFNLPNSGPTLPTYSPASEKFDLQKSNLATML